jgi:hypothetical protein
MIEAGLNGENSSDLEDNPKNRTARRFGKPKEKKGKTNFFSYARSTKTSVSPDERPPTLDKESENLT